MKTSIATLILTTCILSTSALAQENVPHPDPEFKGKIGKTFDDSQADPKLFLPRSAPKDAPNILSLIHISEPTRR